MSEYKLSRSEMETVIRFDSETNTAVVESWMPTIIRKLDKLVNEFPDSYKLISEDKAFNGKRYSVDKSYINFKRPRIMTEEKKREMSERMKKRIKMRYGNTDDAVYEDEYEYMEDQ